jgi:hypothetical protein
MIAVAALLVIAALIAFGKPPTSGISLKHVAEEFAATARTSANANENTQHHRPHGAASATTNAGRLAKAPDADAAAVDAGSDAEP